MRQVISTSDGDPGWRELGDPTVTTKQQALPEPRIVVPTDDANVELDLSKLSVQKDVMRVRMHALMSALTRTRMPACLHARLPAHLQA